MLWCIWERCPPFPHRQTSLQITKVGLRFGGKQIGCRAITGPSPFYPLRSGNFRYVKKIEDAGRNHGRVDPGLFFCFDRCGTVRLGSAAVGLELIHHKLVRM